METAEELAAMLGVPIMTADEARQVHHQPGILGYVIFGVTDLEDARANIDRQQKMGWRLYGVVPGDAIRIVVVMPEDGPQGVNIHQSDVQLLQRRDTSTSPDR
jgi:hypothetical protein